MTMTLDKPLPVPNEDSAPYWEACRKHELRMQRCAQCGHFRFPPSVICPKCTSLEATWEKLSGKGIVYSYILIHRPYHPAFSADAPYKVAMVELEEGPRLHTNIVACRNEDLHIGMHVEVVFEDMNDKISLPKFRPTRP